MSMTEYREAFQIFDQDNDGYVSKKELQKMMEHLGNTLTDQEVNDILKEADAPKGMIDYSAFCSLLGIGVKQSRDADPEEELQHAFKLFDRDRDGVISAKEMTAALAGFGVQLTDREAIHDSMEAKNSSLLFGSGFTLLQASTGSGPGWENEAVHPEEDTRGPF